MEQESKKPAEAVNEDRQQPATRRTGKNGRRRGKYAYAAPLGVFITLLSLVGAMAIIFGGIGLVRRATDTTALKEELYYYLEPLMFYNPTPFEDITTAEAQDAFLNAAAYRVSNAENLRMILEKDENCRYPVDDHGRIAVPVAEVEASYAALFGPDAPLTHRTVSEDGLTFSDGDQCYYVPFSTLGSSYRGVVDTVKRSSKRYTVRVAYVANNDIRLDEHGKEMAPLVEDATYFQTYTLTKLDDSYYVSACADG